MTYRNSTSELKCPFTSQSIELAYGAEVSLFLHCHLRGYDRSGDGVHPDYAYYDKYGAPVSKENSWEEGYHVVEKRLADHYNAVVDKQLKFPLVAGMGGGVHIYKPRHNDEPWNWTGWVPQQRRWLSQGTFFSNRYFLTLRGNEIQNNLWDYDPHEEEHEGGDPEDLEYSQLEPNDRYRGGYWYYCQPFGRYLHIISLKSHEKDPNTGICPRYNYIVHPLAYRPSITTIPDNSVDAMQWSIINMPDERHFGEGEPWGEKCHGLEIFNDFTYYYSYQRLEKDGPYNSHLCEDPQRTIDGDNYYYYWFDTYPLEFAVFLLDSALARGVYFHTMSANDAFYERSSEDSEGPSDVLLADPKGGLLELNMKCRSKSDPRLGVLKTKQPEYTEEEKKFADNLEAIGFLEGRPYGLYSSFGYVTLLDPRLRIKDAVFKEEKGIPHMGLDEGEKLAIEYMRNGDYYATTGLYNLFKYDFTSPLPFKISRQPDKEKLCYDLTKDMELKFTFLKCTEDMAHLIWRYTIMYETSNNELETAHGYFKLEPNNQTILDLRETYTDLTKVKWLYFVAISPRNPQHRAWFHAIKGPAFGKPQFHAKLPNLTHRVVLTKRESNTVLASKHIEPTPVDKGDLDFALGKACNERDIYVYFMQVYPHQQDFSEPVSDMIKESSDVIPPRYLQSVHGYFNCKDDHPTRINLSASWDKNTVKDEKVYFYRIDANTGGPYPMEEGCEPKLFNQSVCH